MFLNNNRGSGAVLALTILPLLFLIYGTFALTGYLIQIKSRVRSTCILQSIELQKEMIGFEKKLFQLNPLSTTLRLRLIAAEAQLLTSAGNPVAIAAALAQIASIREQQQVLDGIQKTIIKTAHFKSQLATAAMLLKIQMHLQEMGSIWQFYLTSFSAMYVSHAAQVAVEPDFEDLAPNYGLTSDYKTAQKLVLTWQHSYRTKQAPQRIIDSANQFEFTCGAGPNKKGNQWSVEINAGKF